MSAHDHGSFDPSKCFQMPKSEGQRPLNKGFPLKNAFVGNDNRLHVPRGRKRQSWGQARGELVVGTP